MSKLTVYPFQHLNSPITREEFLTPFESVVENFWKNSLGNNFESFFGIDGESFKGNSYPKVDIVDYPEKIVIEAEIPGLNKNDISIEFKDDVLSISGSKNVSTNEKSNGKLIRRELKRSSFRRSFSLDDRFETDKIDAEFKDGILFVHLPKKKEVVEKEQSKIINIR